MTRSRGGAKSQARATRQLFIPQKSGDTLVNVKDVEFDWYMGMSFQVRQRSVASCHRTISETGLAREPLEVSSKSETQLGVELSAFNLSGRNQKGMTFTVETVFQSSKRFRDDSGSPYRELLYGSSRDAKRASFLKGKELECFEYGGTQWPLEPKTAFYDWVYINILTRFNHDLAKQLLAGGYDAFTDIEFNSRKSLNTQAYSVALYVALKEREKEFGPVGEICRDKARFLSVIEKFAPYAPELSSRKKRNSQASSVRDSQLPLDM